VFCAPLEGDVVNLSAVTVTKDGKVWFASGTLYNDATDVPYGIAAWDGRQFTYYDPVRDVGVPESHIRDNDRLARWPARRCRAEQRSGLLGPADRKAHIRARRRGNPGRQRVCASNSTRWSTPLRCTSQRAAARCAESASLTRSLARLGSWKRVDGRCTYGGRD